MTSLIYQDGRLKIDGELTYSSIGPLSRELLVQAGREGDLTLDLSAVRACDSACVAMLAACMEVKQRQRDKLLLVNIPPILSTLFRVYELDSVFLNSQES